MKRAELIGKISDSSRVWDLVVVGGGATGLGIALDAAIRGYSVVLFECDDFAKGTSSRSTKLVHGGVRYLAQGDVALVLEALYERGLLQKNAPHLVKNQSFIIPNYTLWDNLLYTVGLTAYDLLAGKLGLGRSKYISKDSAISRIPVLREKGLKGGVIYQDGQFDDARLAINLAQSTLEQGGCVVNHARVTSITHAKSGEVNGVTVVDNETGVSYGVGAKCVINATGVFVDDIMQMDKPTGEHLVRPSQGVHLVLDKSFLQSDYAIMIPKTDDGRVLFAVPWHNKVVVGTTDTLRDRAEFEPIALESEVEFILNTAGRYMTRKPTREDVLSVFAGLRPLAAPKKDSKKTKEISRSHKIVVSDSNLITIIGGKWTTYRRMAQDCVDKAIALGILEKRECGTKYFKIHGYYENPDLTNHMYVYGTDAEGINAIIEESADKGAKLHSDYDYTVAEVIWAVRKEFAMTVEDVLARRVRLLFIDARVAIEVAQKVAEIIADELGHDQKWIEKEVACFKKIAANYILMN